VFIVVNFINHWDVLQFGTLSFPQGELFPQHFFLGGSTGQEDFSFLEELCLLHQLLLDELELLVGSILLYV